MGFVENKPRPEGQEEFSNRERAEQLKMIEQVQKEMIPFNPEKVCTDRYYLVCPTGQKQETFLAYITDIDEGERRVTLKAPWYSQLPENLKDKFSDNRQGYRQTTSQTFGFDEIEMHPVEGPNLAPEKPVDEIAVGDQVSFWCLTGDGSRLLLKMHLTDVGNQFVKGFRLKDGSTNFYGENGINDKKFSEREIVIPKKDILPAQEVDGHVRVLYHPVSFSSGQALLLSGAHNLYQIRSISIRYHWPPMK